MKKKRVMGTQLLKPMPSQSRRKTVLLLSSAEGKVSLFLCFLRLHAPVVYFPTTGCKHADNEEAVGCSVWQNIVETKPGITILFLLLFGPSCFLLLLLF